MSMGAGNHNHGLLALALPREGWPWIQEPTFLLKNIT